MIAVDTSALMAILLEEPEAAICVEAFATNDRIFISAVTVTDVLNVAGRRDLGAEMSALLDCIDLEIVTVSPTTARQAADAYPQWGKGVHPARLNFGDCFAHEVAKTRDCPLLYVGTDFAQTDVTSVL